MSPSRASAEGKFRTVLVIDASGSMQKNDPRELRKVAASLFVDLARDGDEIAVVEFSGKLNPLTPGFLRMDANQRAVAKAAIERVTDQNKDGTDFAKALTEAKRQLEGAGNRDDFEPLVVFLTDGICVPLGGGTTRGCEDKTKHLFDQNPASIRVYALGLRPQKEVEHRHLRAFLKELDKRAAPGFEQAEIVQAPGLWQPFADVYAKVRGSKLLSDKVGGNAAPSASFTIDVGADAVDIVLVGDTNRSPTLVSPSKRAITKQEPNVGYAQKTRRGDSQGYQVYKIQHPAPGTWTLDSNGAPFEYAVLQRFDLKQQLVQPPRSAELGAEMVLAAELVAVDGQRARPEFLKSHRMFLIVDGKDIEMKVAGEGARYEVAYRAPRRVGPVKFGLRIQTLDDETGILTQRTDDIHELNVIAPLKLVFSPIDFGSFKEGKSGTGTLSFKGTHFPDPGRQPVTVEFRGPEGSTVEPSRHTLDPDDPTSMEVTLTFEPPDDTLLDYAGAIAVKPVEPAGAAKPAPFNAHVIPLEWWERTWVRLLIGAVVFVFLLAGFLLPASFRKRTTLHYQDVRDPDFPRPPSSYPLAVKVKAGFYRAASVLLGPSGPVKRGGTVKLVAGGGRIVKASPLLSSASVFRRPVPDEFDDASSSDDEREPVRLTDGTFRVTPGSAYEIDGSGLLFWLS